ncbi:GNAT family N-acetyltransferase [Rubrivirga sp.]|uniref:GNAT family N-acetyltransferase n=1 Tax=Rubrivirga sp. TaxID=1885344 RepID=UPI003B51F04C
MVRPAHPADADALSALVTNSGMFDDAGTREVHDTLAGHLDGENGDALWLVADDGEPVGVLFAAPEPMTDGTWNALMLIVRPDRHGRGHAQALMGALDSALADRGARLLLVETSSLDEYERARAFYPANGFREEARVRDYYQAGDDKIIFSRPVTSARG